MVSFDAELVIEWPLGPLAWLMDADFHQRWFDILRGRQCCG